MMGTFAFIGVMSTVLFVLIVIAVAAFYGCYRAVKRVMREKLSEFGPEYGSAEFVIHGKSDSGKNATFRVNRA